MCTGSDPGGSSCADSSMSVAREVDIWGSGPDSSMEVSSVVWTTQRLDLEVVMIFSRLVTYGLHPPSTSRV